MSHPRPAVAWAEMLVMIGLFAANAFVLTSVVTRERARASESPCAVSERQLGVVLALYAEDQSGRLPPSKPIKGEGKLSFYDVTEPYRRGPLLCPSRGSEPGIPEGLTSGYALNGREEKIVGDRLHDFIRIGWRLTDAENPSRTVLLAEARGGVTGLRSPDRNPIFWRWTSHVGSVTDRFRDAPEGAFRHAGRSNYTFADGHMKSYSQDDLYLSGPFGPTFKLEDSAFFWSPQASLLEGVAESAERVETFLGLPTRPKPLRKNSAKRGKP